MYITAKSLPRLAGLKYRAELTDAVLARLIERNRIPNINSLDRPPTIATTYPSRSVIIAGNLQTP
jgi:hypothetical protein